MIGKKVSALNNGAKESTTKVNGRMAIKMDMDSSTLMMAATTVDNLAVTRFMGKDCTTGKVSKHTRGSGSTTECLERGFSPSKTVRNTMVFSKTTRCTVRAG